MNSILIQGLKFDERGLIPAIIQDASTNDVLGFYFIDNHGLTELLKTGKAGFLRASSGDISSAEFKLVDVRVTQDGCSLTALVDTSGTNGSGGGNNTHSTMAPVPEVSVVGLESMDFGIALNELYELILDRKENRPAGSYTTYLFDSGLDKILKKVAEESGEVIIAAKNQAPREIVAELSDLFYHLIVLMVERGVKLADVQAELLRRRAKTNLREEPASPLRTSQD